VYCGLLIPKNECKKKKRENRKRRRIQNFNLYFAVDATPINNECKGREEGRELGDVEFLHLCNLVHRQSCIQIHKNAIRAVIRGNN
jgi:hypothetical protein